jgi:hypothetical protein
MIEKPLHKLEYRKIVKVSGYITLGAASLFFLIGLFFVVYSAINLENFNEMFSGGIFIICGSFLFWALVIYVQYYFFHRPQMSSEILIFDDKILIKQKGVEFFIFFSDIVRIEYPVHKSMGAWYKAVTKKKTWRFSAMLEGAELPLEEIIKRRPELMPPEDYLKLRTNLILSDHGQIRYYELFKTPFRIWTLLHAVLIPIVAIFLIYLKDTSDQLVIHWEFGYFLEISWHIAVLSILLQVPFITAMNWLIDKDTRHRLEKQNQDKSRNIHHELKIYRKFFPAYLVTLIICLGMYGLSDFYHNYEITNYGNSEGLKFGQDYSVNQKYNCTDCKYKLLKNDYIAYHRSSVGQIVALPGEAIELKKYSSKNRTIASEGVTKVPMGRIAVLGNDGKSTFLIELSEVNGKISK